MKNLIAYNEIKRIETELSKLDSFQFRKKIDKAFLELITFGETKIHSTRPPINSSLPSDNQELPKDEENLSEV